MDVVIVTIGGEFSMEVGFMEPVLEIKQKIECILGVPVANQTLSIYGFELMDGLDIEDYPIISEGSRIYLFIKPMENKIRISVKISILKIIELEVDSTAETVRSLKEKIHIINGAPIKRLTLLFSGKELKEDNRCLCDYGVVDQSEVTVIQKNAMSCNSPTGRIEYPTKMLRFMLQTSSCLLNSAIIPLQMRESAIVAELRQVLLDQKLLPQDDYFFIHRQRIMQDDRSLRWHGVENDDFLYVFKGTVSREIN
ncbi:hypothetical protein Sjap_003312 [Stephania japonica]|uniref:Ubiquitin-like domain-containing protein n=1 Tax=Stephania japonica TaxID=461633 RepID=A0AAP0KNH8_9MAGN